MFHVTYYSYPQSFHVTRKRLFWPIFGRFWALKCHFRLYFERVSYRFPSLPYANSAVNFCGYFLLFFTVFSKDLFCAVFQSFYVYFRLFCGDNGVDIRYFFKKGAFMKCFFCQNVKNAEDVRYCASCNAAFCGACSRGSKCRNCNSLLKFLQ